MKRKDWPINKDKTAMYRRKIQISNIWIQKRMFSTMTIKSPKRHNLSFETSFFSMLLIFKIKPKRNPSSKKNPRKINPKERTQLLLPSSQNKNPYKKVALQPSSIYIRAIVSTKSREKTRKIILNMFSH